MSCRRVVRVQLSVGGAHHLGRGERQRGAAHGARAGPGPRPLPRSSCVPERCGPRRRHSPPGPAQAGSTEVPTQGSRTVPSPTQRCSASVLSTPKQPHRTEGFDPLGVSGRIPAPGNPCTPRRERGLLAASSNVPGRHGPAKLLAPRRPCHGRATGHSSCFPAPTPQGPGGLSPAPTLRAPPGLEVPLSSQPLAGAAGPCAVPGPGGDPSHQSKDGVGIGNWDLPETPLLRPLPPGKARSSLGMHRPKDRQAARPWRGVSALPRLVEELPSDSHSAQLAGLRQATAPRNKPGDPCASPTPPCSAGRRRRTRGEVCRARAGSSRRGREGTWYGRSGAERKLAPRSAPALRRQRREPGPSLGPSSSRD